MSLPELENSTSLSYFCKSEPEKTRKNPKKPEKNQKNPKKTEKTQKNPKNPEKNWSANTQHEKQPENWNLIESNSEL